MYKLYISLLLVAIGVLWFFLPHITTGVLTVVVCVLLIVASLALRIVIKKHLKTEAVAEADNSPHRKSVFILTSLLLLIALIVFRGSSKAVCILSVASALWMVLLFSSSLIVRDFSWKNTVLPMCVCVLPVFLALLWTRIYHMGLYPVIQFYSTVLAFGISYWLILSINLERNHSEILLIYLLLCGFVLTYSLNYLCTNSPKEVHAYTAKETNSYGTSCEIDDGWRFTYRNCPIKIGRKGTVFQYEGWFNIVYLEPVK